MRQEDLTTDTDRHGDQLPPIRPGPIMLFIVAIVVVAGAVVVNSAAISSFMIFFGIKTAQGL